MYSCISTHSTWVNTLLLRCTVYSWCEILSTCTTVQHSNFLSKLITTTTIIIIIIVFYIIPYSTSVGRRHLTFKTELKHVLPCTFKDFQHKQVIVLNLLFKSSFITLSIKRLDCQVFLCQVDSKSG